MFFVFMNFLREAQSGLFSPLGCDRVDAQRDLVVCAESDNATAESSGRGPEHSASDKADKEESDYD